LGPDKVVLMNGVNDAHQHVGASASVKYTGKLVEYFADRRLSITPPSIRY
jgi:hypothetical protein